LTKATDEVYFRAIIHHALMNSHKKSRKAVWWLSGLAGGAVLLTGLATLGTAAPTNDFSPAQNTAAAVNALTPVAAPVAAPIAQPQQETKTAIQAAPQSNTTSESGLSNDNHYANSSGNTVHSPAYSESVPAGASAQCGDGTYSFSQNRRGTCSHQGGVAEWL
jgi:Protein of unknown function (DUF3761)